MILPSKEFLDVFRKTNGALSVTESIAIMNIAAQVPKGWYVELGTHKGKSAISAIVGLKDGRFILVDPIFDDRELERTVFELCYSFNQEMKLYLRREYSTDIIPTLPNDFSYVFVDSGSHQDGLPMQEVKLLEGRIVKDGIIAFHDFKSQFVEVEQAYNYLLSTGKYEEIKINWEEIIEYVNENNLEDGNQSWHHTESKNPCFVGALKRI